MHDLGQQVQTPLLDALGKCAQKDHAPFYAPGHKGGQGISSRLIELLHLGLKADLPELPELDNLFAPTGAIAAAQMLAAAAFGAEQTWFLANGSTAGIVAAILACCGPGDKIILPRNVHSSAIAGVILADAVPVFVMPVYDGELDLAYSITPEDVSTTLRQHPDARAVMLLYPTYQGVGGEIGAIAEIVHQYHIPLLVDEAHGAHFAFDDRLPPTALSAGADLAVQSTHKTLGAMTQGAMLHRQGDLINPARIARALQLVQSTSPNYILLASLDAARQQMATAGAALMAKTIELSNQARQRLAEIPRVRCLQMSQPRPGFSYLDPTRLTITVDQWGINGWLADEILHQQLGVTVELPLSKVVTLIVSVGNTQSDIDRLIEAFRQLERKMQAQTKPVPEIMPSLCETMALEVTPRAAFFAPHVALPIASCIHRISAELVCPYPPGIPILIPGETITQAAVEYLQQATASGGVVTGCSDPSLTTLKVVD